MNREAKYYRRKLPHYQTPYANYFITFRLTESLPFSIVKQLKDEYIASEADILKLSERRIQKVKMYDLQKRYFKKYDDILDKNAFGPSWLINEKIAQLIYDAIHAKDKKVYELLAYCIMPNHVHIVFKLIEDNVEQTLVCCDNNSNKRTEVRSTVAYQNYALAKLLREIKGSTAREANKVLNRTGPFWQHESYDHVVRNDKELENIIRYVLNNPVKAGLVEKWEEWKWNYCSSEIISLIDL